MKQIKVLLRGLWVLFQFGAAGAGGFILAWGPLQTSLPVAYLIATLLGLGVAGLWARQQWAAIQGNTAVARAWGRFLYGGTLLVFLAVGGLALFQSYQMGMLPPLSDDYAANFDRLWAAVDAYYPYFEVKEVDWEAVRAEYRPQAEAAQSDAEFYEAVDGMLDSLHDAHTGLMQPSNRSFCTRYASIREMEGLPVLRAVSEAGSAAGLQAGDLIETVNGRPAAAMVAEMETSLHNASTPWQARARAFSYLLHTPAGETLDVTLKRAGGETVSLTLTCDLETHLAQTVPAADEPLVTWERLPSGVGLIRIPTFGTQRDLVAEFETALAALQDAPGLILDIRGNGGGDTGLSDPIAGHFLPEYVLYGHDYFVKGQPIRGWVSRVPYDVHPQQPYYDRPVVLLIDPLVMSTAENFAVALVDSGRATAVGRRSGGASGNPVSFKLPGEAQARFSTGDFRRMDGTRLEGIGVQPDAPVAWTVADARAGRDPDVETAVALITQSAQANSD